MIKAIFLDFDGTVFSHHTSSIPASTINAIRQLREKGVYCFLCTGRALGEMHDFDLSDFPLDGWIMSNGQVILDENMNFIYEKKVEGKLKDTIISLFNEKKMPMYVVTREEYYINYLNQTVLNIQSVISSGIPPVKEYKGEDIYMASAFFSSQEERQILKEFDGIAEITWWNEGAVDIIPKGVSKISGINEILKRYEIDVSETMAIGDGQNDIPMIQYCAIGVAMGNSYEEVKQHADYITDDIDGDGLYNALKHYELL